MTARRPRRAKEGVVSAWLWRLTRRLRAANERLVAKQVEVRKDIHDLWVADRIWEERIR